jgi:hypothetical protein
MTRQALGTHFPSCGVLFVMKRGEVNLKAAFYGLETQMSNKGKAS